MSIFKSKRGYIAVAAVVVFVPVYLIYKSINPTIPKWVTATVERGDVSETVSVSGFVEAKKQAELAFPTTGTITGVLVEEGSEVKKGEVLATIAATQLVAERAEAVAALTSAKASYGQTVVGPRTEVVALANTNLINAEENLSRVTVEENRKVENARIALLSTGLTAAAVDIEEESRAPQVSGNYTCNAEGTYRISVYSSGGSSGFSYNYSGLESGTASVGIDQPAPLGNCGLFLLFTAGDRYNQTEWEITVPNTRSATYTSLKNTLALTTTQAQNAIDGARSSLARVTNETSLSTAPARREEVTSALANVTQAEARVAAIDARLADRSIVAPFDGIITEVSITVGESASQSPVISILNRDSFTLKARVPEIDITKISTEQKVTAVFDAQSSDTLTGKIIYVSPVATLIDGVAYFETTMELSETPLWMRAGLNADIDIITDSKENVLRLPKRFVTTLPDGTSVVQTPQGKTTATTTIEVIFTGNDSFVGINGLPEGTTVVAP
jgi:HlyD family secretion protein